MLVTTDAWTTENARNTFQNPFNHTLALTTRATPSIAALTMAAHMRLTDKWLTTGGLSHTIHISLPRLTVI